MAYTGSSRYIYTYIYTVKSQLYTSLRFNRLIVTCRSTIWLIDLNIFSNNENIHAHTHKTARQKEMKRKENISITFLILVLFVFMHTYIYTNRFSRCSSCFHFLGSLIQFDLFSPFILAFLLAIYFLFICISAVYFQQMLSFYYVFSFFSFSLFSFSYFIWQFYCVVERFSSLFLGLFICG